MESNDSWRPSAAVEETFLEYQRRRRQGGDVEFETFCAARPQMASDLHRLRDEWERVQSIFARLSEEAGAPEDRKRSDAESRLLEPPAPNDRYEVKDEISRGGMGAILRVFDRGLRRHLAMKVILEPRQKGAGPLDPRLRSRFLDEAQITAQLDHPGIVPVHELGLDANGRLYFTMKLVKGEDLRSIFGKLHRGEDGWTRARALGVLLRVCDAMAFAHERGVIHRDLKPANIMVGNHGETYVMDWGLARSRDAEDRPDALVTTARREDWREPSSDVTVEGDVLGTPAYMAPEQAHGHLGEIGPPTDVFAMGAILYHLLTGCAPYTDESGKPSNQSILERARRGPPTPARDLAADTSPEILAICEKAMARSIHDRYRDMTRMAADLQAYLENRVVSAHKTGALVELRKWVTRNRAAAAGIAGAIVLSITGLSAVFAIQSVAKREIERQLSDVLRLSDARRLAELTKEKDALFPPEPRNIAALEDWLSRARALASRLREHTASLAALRTHAEPGDHLEESRTVWTFADPQQQWWHEALVSLVTGLTRFVDEDPRIGAIAEVQERLDWASTVQKTTIDDHRAEWDAARAAIADITISSQYQGLRIIDQIGLIPLDRDPQSGLFEFWHPASGTQPMRDRDGRLVSSESSSLVFVLVPGGSFAMGAQASDSAGTNYDPGAIADEQPVTIVRLDPFFLSKYEMTQGQWTKCTAANPSYWAPGRYRLDLPVDLRNPVEKVSHVDCTEAMRRVGLSLPTEAQWEYAARAGTPTVWWTGNGHQGIAEAGNVTDSYARAHSGRKDWEYDDDIADGHFVHAQVGSYRANAFGLHDVIGNVWEWCRDPYTLYDVAARDGDGARATDDRSMFVCRGGSFGYPSRYARSASRAHVGPGLAEDNFGLRPARVLDR